MSMDLPRLAFVVEYSVAIEEYSTRLEYTLPWRVEVALGGLDFVTGSIPPCYPS